MIDIEACKAWMGLAQAAGTGWSSTTFINKTWHIRRLKIRVHWRRGDGITGRFGGGWNWNIGIQMGSTTIILNCLVFNISFYLKKKEKS